MARDDHDFMAQARRDIDERRKGYRARALELFPHVCAHCGREFSGRALRELTVHHKDHDHDNNPPDGSNWELLCIYCHDNEHGRDQVADHGGSGSTASDDVPVTTHKPFAKLAELMAKGSKDK